MAPQANPLCGNESYMDPLVIIFSKKCVLDIKSHLKPCFFSRILQVIFTFFPEITFFILSRLGINSLCARGSLVYPQDTIYYKIRKQPIICLEDRKPPFS